jgi:predicted acetylornithine/succinylornithine family transaminase
MKKNYINLENQSIFQTYKRLPIVVDFAKGCYINAKEGKKYLDFLAGIAVNVLGHSHPKILKAIAKQSAKYIHLSNYFYQDIQIRLAIKIKHYSGFDRVFFTNSGTEATEAAIKLTRRWGSMNGKSTIIGFTGGFHGRSYGALSLMDKPVYKEGMGPFLPDTKIIEYNNIQALEENIDERTAGVFLEFLQGEGGIVSAKKEFVEKIVELKQKYGFLIIADEVQTCSGRTGKYLCFMHHDVKPDVVTLAKGIGGGLPLGCMLAREYLANVWEKGMHGTTFGGNALACACGLVVLNEIGNGLIDKVVKIGDYLNSGLEAIKNKYPDKVLEVRGLGLMKGLLLSFNAADLVAKLLEKGIISNATAGRVLRIVPPLIIKRKDVDKFIKALDNSFTQI